MRQQLLIERAFEPNLACQVLVIRSSESEEGSQVDILRTIDCAGIISAGEILLAKWMDEAKSFPVLVGLLGKACPLSKPSCAAGC